MKTNYQAFTTFCIKCHMHKARNGGKVKKIHGRQRFTCAECLEEELGQVIKEMPEMCG